MSFLVIITSLITFMILIIIGKMFVAIETKRYMVISVIGHINYYFIRIFVKSLIGATRGVKTLNQLLDILTYFHHFCPSLYILFTGHSLDLSDKFSV